MADRPRPGARILATTSAVFSEVLCQIIPNSTFVSRKTANEFALECDASLIRYYSRRYFQFHDGFCSKTVNTSAIPYGGDAFLDSLMSQRQAYQRARAMLRSPRYLTFVLDMGAWLDGRAVS